jgi:hypothetical protein
MSFITTSKRSIELSLLNSYLGKDIKELCPNEYADPKKNHCAHFVSHVLNLSRGYTCATGKENGANLRVHELFIQCPRVYEFNSCPSVICGLIFVSHPSNFFSLSEIPFFINNVPKKHIGIIYNQNIWHYSNSQDKVIVQTMGEFIRHYKKQKNALWYGEIPPYANPAPWKATS